MPKDNSCCEIVDTLEIGPRLELSGISVTLEIPKKEPASRNESISRAFALEATTASNRRPPSQPA
jgi:hypothetical protein